MPDRWRIGGAGLGLGRLRDVVQRLLAAASIPSVLEANAGVLEIVASEISDAPGAFVVRARLLSGWRDFTYDQIREVRPNSLEMLNWTLSVGGGCADQSIQGQTAPLEMNASHHCGNRHDRIEVVADLAAVVDMVGIASIGIMPVSFECSLALRGSRPLSPRPNPLHPDSSTA